MRRIFFFILFNCIFLNAQEKAYTLIDIKTKKEYEKKDSADAVKFLDSLAQNHYFFTKVKEVKYNTNRIEIFFDKGKNFNEAWVKLSDSISSDFNIPKEFYTKNLDSLKQKINQKYSEKGYSFNRVKSKFQNLKDDNPVVKLSVVLSEKRTINGFVFRGYEKVPTRFIKNLEREFHGKTYDNKNLLLINNQFLNHPYISLEKPPQTLFTKDSTQIYLFAQKRKSNTFDGVIGFGNNERERFTLNGTLNVSFRNIFNGFESISLYWQRNPNKGQIFDLQTDIPYLLKSNIGTKMNINIFRQDSTFANVKMLPSFYYQLSFRQKIGLNANVEISSVFNSNYSSARNFRRNGLGLWYEYIQPTGIELFLYNAMLRAETDVLSTHYEKEKIKTRMFRYFLFGEKNINLKNNHYLNLKAESAALMTKETLAENEVFRIGGWNSLRGFNEKSILSNFYTFGGIEYRYLINNQSFFDLFVQYAQIENKNLNVNTKFYSIGTGFNLFLPIGLITFQISNGNQFEEPFNFRNTKIHWGILTRF